MKPLRIAVVLVVIGLAACDRLKLTNESYTLYRNSPLDVGESMRIHVATFDTEHGEDYNRQNCEIARELFQQQPGVIARYWCEKGPFEE